jgi:ribosomal protein L11 methyltransferase
MAESTYRFSLGVPKRVASMSREDFYEWLWAQFGRTGLVGVHEGTVLSEDAAELGLETESWTVDAAEAPRERDWIGGQKIAQADLYFESRKAAEGAVKRLRALHPELGVGAIQEQPPQDWDAEWKASFLSQASGVRIAPNWRILPPWVSEDSPELARLNAPILPGERVIRVNPGAGFGTGTHETTQLCLKAIAEFFGRRKGPAEVRALDFGSGSGILSIGAALLGADVDGVEIDPLAIDNAEENSRINDVEERIAYFRDLAGAPGPYPLVIANILRPVLLEFAPELVRRLEPGGTLVLSGLIATDTPSVSEAYSALLKRRPVETSLGEWRSLVWGS